MKQSISLRILTILTLTWKRPSTRLLLAFSLFSLALLALRITISGRVVFGFLIWNLFLAFVPWFISTITELSRLRRAWIKWLLMLLWVLFFPNAPYILTDMIHLGLDRAMPKWFDLIMLLSFAFSGLIFGFVSLNNIESVLEIKRRPLNHLVLAGLIYLACFGIYLGRFLRFNSWDLFNKAQDLFLDIVDRVANPLAYATTWIFTFLLGTFVYLAYLGFRYVGRDHHPRTASRPAIRQGSGGSESSESSPKPSQQPLSQDSPGHKS